LVKKQELTKRRWRIIVTQKFETAKNNDKIKKKSPTTTNERVVKTQRKKARGHTPVENKWKTEV